MSIKLKINKTPKISIIIPSYNKVNFIGDTLTSIFNQNYPNLEVIVQDGGSTDGTLEVIRTFAKTYPLTMKYESKKDNGRKDAINKGLKNASGEILTFLNSDDIYEKVALHEVAKAYNENPNALWFAGKGIVINSNGKEIMQLITIYKNFLLKINSYNLLLITNYLMQPSVFITEKLLKKYGTFVGVGKAVMEYEKWLTVGKNMMPIVINKNLSKFRLYDSAFSSSFNMRILSEDLKIVKRFTNNNIVIFLHEMNNLGRKMIL